MLMTEQTGQPGVGLTHRLAYRAGVDIDAQRQGVDKHPQRALCTLAALHPAHQDGAEYYVLSA